MVELSCNEIRLVNGGSALGIFVTGLVCVGSTIANNDEKIKRSSLGIAMMVYAIESGIESGISWIYHVIQRRLARNAESPLTR